MGQMTNKIVDSLISINDVISVEQYYWITLSCESYIFQPASVKYGPTFRYYTRLCIC